MNTETWIKGTTAAAALCLTTLPISAADGNPANAYTPSNQERTLSSNPNLQQVKTEAEVSPRAHAARDFLGREIVDTTGQRLGSLKDLVVDTRSGRIAFAVVSSGGLLGVGETVRAVPFSTLKQDATTDKARLTASIERSQWDAAPTLTATEVSNLGQSGRAEEIYRHFGQEWRNMGPQTAMTEARSQARDGKQRRDTIPAESAAGTTSGEMTVRSFVLASNLQGQDIESATNNEEVGEVDDLVVNFDRGIAAVLMDPEDEFTGNDEKFVIPMNRLMARTGDNDGFTTNLTREDFASAMSSASAQQARRENERARTGSNDSRLASRERSGELYQDDRIVTWNQYRLMDTTAAYPLVDSGVRTTAPVPLASATRSSEMPPVERVRDVLSREALWSTQSRDIQIRTRNDQLVIEGTAPSKELKNRLIERVEEAAQGWEIEDKITVSNQR